MTDSEFLRVSSNGVESSDGWAVQFLAPDLLEYRCGYKACLLNVDYSAEHRATQIYATESRSDLFPQLLQHLRAAVGQLHGCYRVV